MRVDDQTKVTNAIASAIEYITKLHSSVLSAVVVRELRAANAIVSVAATRELKTLPKAELKAFAQHALNLLSGPYPESGPWPTTEERFTRVARELAKPPFEIPRISASFERPTGAPPVEAGRGNTIDLYLEYLHVERRLDGPAVVRQGEDLARLALFAEKCGTQIEALDHRALQLFIVEECPERNISDLHTFATILDYYRFLVLNGDITTNPADEFEKAINART
jgi:hypothetical protein